MKRTYFDLDYKHTIEQIELCDKQEAVYYDNEKMHLKILFSSKENSSSLCFRMMIYYLDDTVAGMATSKANIQAQCGMNEVNLTFQPGVLADGTYKARIAFYSVNEFGTERLHDVLDCGFSFVKENKMINNLSWNHSVWGHTNFPEIEII